MPRLGVVSGPESAMCERTPRWDDSTERSQASWLPNPHTPNLEFQPSWFIIRLCRTDRPRLRSLSRTCPPVRTPRDRSIKSSSGRCELASVAQYTYGRVCVCPTGLRYLSVAGSGVTSSRLAVIGRTTPELDGYPFIGLGSAGQRSEREAQLRCAYYECD